MVFSSVFQWFNKKRGIKKSIIISRFKCIGKSVFCSQLLFYRHFVYTIHPNFQPSIAQASNIDTLLGATEKSELAQPSESIQDKVHFIFNNISTNNLTQKVTINCEQQGLHHMLLVELVMCSGCNSQPTPNFSMYFIRLKSFN